MPSALQDSSIVNIELFFTDFEARKGKTSKSRRHKIRSKLGFLPLSKKACTGTLTMQDLNRHPTSKLAYLSKLACVQEMQPLQIKKRLHRVQSPKMLFTMLMEPILSHKKTESKTPRILFPAKPQSSMQVVSAALTRQRILS